MKKIKTFRISEEAAKKVASLAKKLDRSESWIINKCIEKAKI